MIRPEKKAAVGRALGQFLVALAGTDRVAMGATGDVLRRMVQLHSDEDCGHSTVLRCAAHVSVLRHYELSAPSSADRAAFGNARAALEERLEAILEDLMHPAGEATAETIGRGQSLLDGQSHRQSLTGED